MNLSSPLDFFSKNLKNNIQTNSYQVFQENLSGINSTTSQINQSILGSPEQK